MRKKFSTSELGSMMIEALAMLALIALVTPILYRKTAERTTELQDINTAGELRAIIKAVDDYVAANYDAIANGQKVTNSCTAGTHQTQDYKDFKDATDAKVSVPIGHFCEFLPYGILDASGNAKQSRLFSANYQIVLKLKGSSTSSAEKGDKVITSFVITEPNNDMPEIRSSSIASMIGGNGGYVTSTSGSGSSATGEISGNLGIWGVGDTKKELGVSVSKNAVVAASIQGISSQSAKIDISGVLYRIKQGGDVELNTMSTDLYMGQHGTTTRHNITNIGKLIVGSESSGANDKLYIASGDIKINGAGNITMSGAGNLSMANGNISVAAGNLMLSNGSATISGTLSAGANAFTVGAAGATKALSYATNNDKIKLNISDKSVINQPLEVNGCEKSSTHAFCVKGNSHFEGNVTITDTFDAKNLHASEKLTVGGSTVGTGKTLSVVYTKDAVGSLAFGENIFKLDKSADNKGTLNFGSDLFKIEETAAKTGTLSVADDLMKLVTADKSFSVNGTTASVTAGDAVLSMASNASVLKSNTNNYLELGSTDAKLVGSSTVQLNGDSFKVTGTKDKIESTVKSFKVTSAEDSSQKMELTKNKLEVATAQVDFNAGTTRRDFNIKNMDVHVKAGNSDTDFLRMSNNGAGTAQIDFNDDKVLMHQEGTTGTKILKIDLVTSPTTSESYPVYIRKGAIELTAEQSEAGHLAQNYVKADRFVANTSTTNNIRKDDNSAAATAKYEVNPAYTSVMHDIKLTSRGGARLSDVLPDFINKGIYVVDNTYPAKGYKGCGASTGGPALSSYFTKTRNQKIEAANCTSLSDEASPWAGFVPTPTCPPGYAKVITFTPASFAMAQAGYPQASTGQHKDLHQNYSFAGPLNTPDASPVPLYAQKNTWLKSFVQTAYASNATSASSSSGTVANFQGWDVGIGFIYPYTQYQSYADSTGGSGGSNYDSSGSASTGTKVIWNMFPVYAGTLEGYATVYCYFNRGGGSFNSDLVDTNYDQLSKTNYRRPNSKDAAGGGANATNKARLNSKESDLNGTYW